MDRYRYIYVHIHMLYGGNGKISSEKTSSFRLCGVFKGIF